MSAKGQIYHEYVTKCQQIKSELDRLRREYLGAKGALVDQKRELDRVYRETRMETEEQNFINF